MPPTPGSSARLISTPFQQAVPLAQLPVEYEEAHILLLGAGHTANTAFILHNLWYPLFHLEPHSCFTRPCPALRFHGL